MVVSSGSWGSSPGSEDDMEPAEPSFVLARAAASLFLSSSHTSPERVLLWPGFSSDTISMLFSARKSKSSSMILVSFISSGIRSFNRVNETHPSFLPAQFR